MATGYLVVKISDPLNKKSIGCKCIPASWAENALRDNYSIIRYPKEDNSKTREQVKLKEPSKKTWPFYCALIMFRTDSYEKAIEFITENDTKDSPARMHEQDDTAADKQPDNTMNEIKASASATPSTSGKRRHSEETYNNTINEDSLPKKKRESAIRFGNNLKMLIQNKLLHCKPKEKVSPKKVLSLRKEALTETLKTLISAGKFTKLEKLYTQTVVAESRGSTVNDEIIATDDSDSNNEPDTMDLPDRNILQPVPTSEPNPTNTTKKPERSKSPLLDTVIDIDDSDSHNETDTIPPPDKNIIEPVPISKLNPTNTTKKPERSKTPLHGTVIAIDDSDSHNEPDTIPISKCNPTNTTNKAERTKTPLIDTVIAIDDSDSHNEPDTIPPPGRNILEPVPISEPNPTNSAKKPERSKSPLHGTVIAIDDSDSHNEPDTIPISKCNPTNTTNKAERTKTPLLDTVIAIDDSDSHNEPNTIPPPSRNILEPVPISEPNSTNNPGRSKTPLHETVTATEDSDTSNEPETIHPPERNRLELFHGNESNPTNTTKNSGKSKTPLPETVDSDQTQISCTNNLEQQKESNTNFKGFQPPLNAEAEVSALQNLIQHLAPENGTKNQNIVDNNIKHIEDIYNSILEVKSKINAVYMEKSKQLKKAFESVNLFVPELKKGLSLPTIQQLKENSRPNSDKLKTVSSLQEHPSQRKQSSSHPRTLSRQQSESSSDS